MKPMKAAALEILKDFENPPDIINPYEDGFEENDRRGLLTVADYRGES